MRAAKAPRFATDTYQLPTGWPPTRARGAAFGPTHAILATGNLGKVTMRCTTWFRPMDRQRILVQLAAACRLITQGERHIVEQRQLVAEMERDGHDSSILKNALEQFEKLHAQQIAERDRLENELAAYSG